MARNSGQRSSARAGLLGNMAAKHSKEMYGRNKTQWRDIPGPITILRYA